jgi:hypothetical protein
MNDEIREIRVYCDGKELPLAPFVSKLFYDTIAAMAANLKGAEKAQTITITLAKPPAAG